MRQWVWAVLVVGSVLALAVQAEEPASESVDVIDATGKAWKLKNFKPTTGVRRLSWLGEAVAPLALELRETHSTTFAKGIITLVPITSLESIRYDYDKKSVSVQVRGQGEPLVGSLQYKGVNALGFEAESEGVVGKFAGGVPATGIRSIAFSNARPLPARTSAGTNWVVQIVQPTAKDPTVRVRNLKPLFAFSNGGEVLLEALPIRKAEALSFTGTGLKRLEMLAVDPNTHFAAVEVSSAVGPERVLAVPLTLEQDKKIGTLVGLLGEVDAGWKLFPLHTIRTIALEAKP